MSTQTDSFDGSRLGAFTESAVQARNSPCKPRVLGASITNSTDPVRRCWELILFLGTNPFRAACHTRCGFWRLIELGDCYPGGYPWYGAGCIDENGVLIGLPDEFCSGFPYDGFMELQIGCLSADETVIEWPGECQTTTPVFDCAAAVASPVVIHPQGK